MIRYLKILSIAAILFIPGALIHASGPWEVHDGFTVGGIYGNDTVVASTTDSHFVYVADIWEIASLDSLSGNVVMGTTLHVGNSGTSVRWADVSSYVPGDGTYYILMNHDASGGNSGQTSFVWLTVSGGVYTYSEQLAYVTRIDSVTPAGGSVNATSTSFTFGATGYVNQDDFVEGATYVHIHAQDRNQTIAIVSVLTASETQSFETKDFTFPVTASGNFSFSTTSSMIGQIGGYIMTTSVETPRFSIFGFNFGTNTLVSTSTAFILSTTTALDQIAISLGTQYGDLLLASSSAHFSCEITNIPGCIYSLFIPSGENFQQDFTDLRNNVLTHKPWGYVSRFVTVITATGTQALPTFTANIVIGPPGNLATTSLTFDPGDMLAGGATLLDSIKDPEHGKSLRDIAEPMLWLFLGITMLIIIVHDLLAMGHHKKSINTSLH